MFEHYLILFDEQKEPKNSASTKKEANLRLN
jgi:hypothetical protein